MLLFLYGKDTYRGRRKLREIVVQYQKVYSDSLSLKSYDLSVRASSKFGRGEQNLTFQNFKEELQQPSIFREKKLVILENVFSNEEFRQEVLRNKEVFLNSKDIIVFFEQDSKILEGDSLANFLKKNGKSQRFDLLEGEKLKNWLEKEFGEAIEGKGVLDMLIEFVGNDLWRLTNEITKLISYKKGSAITLEDIKLLVKPKIETAIFKTIDSIAQGDKKRALRLIETHLKKGDSPFYLLKMISYQFRNLLLAKAGSLYKSGLHPFVIKKTLSLAKNFSFEELKDIYQKIFETDLGIKTGRITPDEGIKMLIGEI